MFKMNTLDNGIIKSLGTIGRIKEQVATPIEEQVHQLRSMAKGIRPTFSTLLCPFRSLVAGCDWLIYPVPDFTVSISSKRSSSLDGYSITTQLFKSDIARDHPSRSLPIPRRLLRPPCPSGTRNPRPQSWRRNLKWRIGHMQLAINAGNCSPKRTPLRQRTSHPKSLNHLYPRRPQIVLSGFCRISDGVRSTAEIWARH